MNYELSKRERIVSRKLIETLFSTHPARRELLPEEARVSRSMSAFPLRVVYMKKERAEEDAPVQMLVSVSKRHFKHAVDRNRVKRQVREAYRRHKHLLFDVVPNNRQLLVAFIWLADDHRRSAAIEGRVVNLLQRISEREAE